LPPLISLAVSRRQVAIAFELFACAIRQIGYATPAMLLPRHAAAFLPAVIAAPAVVFSALAMLYCA